MKEEKIKHHESSVRSKEDQIKAVETLCPNFTAFENLHLMR
jgi:hypothetical protein